MRKFLIVIIPTILIITFGGYLFIHRHIAVPETDISQKDVVQKITENTVYEEANINVVEEVDNNEQKTDKSEIKVEKEETTTSSTQKTENTQVKKQETKKESSSTKNETKKQEESIVVPEQKDNNTVEEKPKDEITVPEKEETKEEVVEEKEEVPQVKDEYKRNNTMIEQMKNVIMNNESDLMKELGYNIVVDSSIITETNQFTFTEFRVKNKIINAFGTIKIYAQDYYHNGQYMYTECYLM